MTVFSSSVCVSLVFLNLYATFFFKVSYLDVPEYLSLYFVASAIVRAGDKRNQSSASQYNK